MTITSAWPSTEAAIHRWVRESTGLAATSVYWPSKGLTRPDPPCCHLSLVGGRATGWAGVRGGVKTAQPTEWLATVNTALGTHGVQLWTDSGATPDVDSDVTIIDPLATITVARNALLADLGPLLPAGITAVASGTASIAIAGATATDVFSMGSTSTVDLTLVQAPYSSTRHTRAVTILMLDFRATPTAGEGSAREYASIVRNAVGDYRRLLARCGWAVGAQVGDRPGYAEDATESRYILEFELLGNEIDYAIPRPWVRRGPAVTVAASGLTTSFQTA